MARTALTYIATEHNLTREEMLEVAGGQYSSRNTAGLVFDIDAGVLYAKSRRDADAIQRLAAEYAARRDAAQAPATETSEPMATPRQVAYIMTLIGRGAHEEGGFYKGPTTEAGVRALPKAHASLYITSLTGKY